MDGSQLFVLTHKHLGPQYFVEIRDVDEVKIGSYVRNKKRGKPQN